jgi:hypothetical protein
VAQYVSAPPEPAEAAEAPAAPVQSLEAASRRVVLQPINEAAVMEARAQADAEVARETAAHAEQHKAEQDAAALGMPVAPQPVIVPPAQVSKAEIAADIARGPDNAPVPAVKTTVQDFLPPVIDKNGNVDNSFDETVTTRRLVVAGVGLPFVWAAISYGANWLIGILFLSQLKENPSGIVLAMKQWSIAMYVAPFAVIVMTAIVAYFIVNYPHKGYRALLSLVIPVFFVGVLMLLPHSGSLGGFITNPIAVLSLLTHLGDSGSMSPGSLWITGITFAVTIALGLASVFLFYNLVIKLRFKVPHFLLVIMVTIIALIPAIGLVVTWMLER